MFVGYLVMQSRQVVSQQVGVNRGLRINLLH